MLCGLQDSISGGDTIRVGAAVEPGSKTCRPALALLQMSRLRLFDAVFMLPAGAPLLVGTPPQEDEQETRRMRDRWVPLSVATVAWANAVLSLSQQQQSGGSCSVSREAWEAPRGCRGDERYIFFAAAVSGLRGLYTLDKKKVVPMAGFALRECLRIDSETARSVQVIFDASGAAAAMAEHPPGQPPDRESMGLFVRGCRGLWRAALVVACAGRLALSCDSSAMTQAEVAAAVDIPPAACDAIARYVALETRICTEGLGEAWLAKPLLDGNQLAAAVGVPRGPSLGRLMEEAVRWQLRCPQGSTEQLVAHLRDFVLHM